MNDLKPLDTQHEDMVLDIAYDFYGKYLATGSADHHIKVFELDPDTNSWILNDSWRAHDSSVIKIDFAHPQYGHLLVSASYDRTVKIWEERYDDDSNTKRWTKLKTLADAHGPLYDVCFLPAWLGLKIATIGNDGILRVYESSDPSDLTNWFLLDESKVLNNPVASHLQSDFNIKWCPSKFGCEKFVVSALDKAYIYYKSDDSSTSDINNTINSSNNTIDNNNNNATTTNNFNSSQDLEDNSGKYKLAITLPDHNGLIRSVSWAPPMGKSYHLIATACKDGYVRIFKLEEFKNENGVSFNISLLNSFNDHKGEVWRVRWNLTGTILSSAGDDGTIRLYKANYANKFQCMSVIDG